MSMLTVTVRIKKLQYMYDLQCTNIFNGRVTTDDESLIFNIVLKKVFNALLIGLCIINTTLLKFTSCFLKTPSIYKVYSLPCSRFINI
jgi:hypothetical protein